ncbi:RagB/SusD family nutrient uptake outer membrane protein [Flavobacteriaceae bacterium AH-315-O20]|nr:RagB/SusD family nutrient uptake outer membrane protein [Flavobacteriaceae bacterium AH-315-O20]
MKIMIKKQIKEIGLLTLMSILFMISCTNLEIKETDSIFTISTDEFNGVENVESSITNLYNALRGQLEDQANYYAMAEVSTDEILVPTRGTDWGDNGLWRTLHAHTWTPPHTFVFTVWNQFNQNTFLATEILDSRSNPTPAQEAEAKFIRAYSMWIIMDTYGVVPFRQPDEGPEIDPVVFSSTEAYDFILQDLNDAISNLPVTGPSSETGVASKASANFLKARLLLNAHIYKGTGSADSGDMAEVIAAVDAIANDGFGLQAGYFDLFTEAVDNETIWFTNSSTGNRIWNGLHYNQISPDNTGGGWNGFTTLAEFYDLFEGDPNSNYVGDGQEERRGFVPDNLTADASNLGIGYGFLIGQQYDVNGTPLNDRPGAPLVFKKELPGLVGNDEQTGIRMIKYHPVNGAFAGHQVIFRYADAHLMKAEAMMRSGGDPSAMVNELRVIRGAAPLPSVSESDLLEERGRELYMEFVRRTDLIRFGQFTKDWDFKDSGSIGDENRNLYPIPSNAILSNPNLVQNPGY